MRFCSSREYGSAVAAIFGGVILGFRMLYYGARRMDLLRKGVCVGAPIGMVLGALGALAVVHPEDHGFARVFLSGLHGRTLWSMTRRRVPARLGGTGESPAALARRVDIFDEGAGV
eukprot:SAG22_NODE_2028_length_3118_cov_1.428619_2_plen_116_part_00